MSPRRHLIAALAAMAVTAGAGAQVDLEPLEPVAPSPFELESLEPGVGDVDPLAVGLRQLQVDLRSPVEFERVYRVPGRDDLLMRVQGGLYAIFPRSWYVATRSGTRPVMPNDTVFHIGVPQPDWLDRWFPTVVDDLDVIGPDSGRLGRTVRESGRLELRLDHALSYRASAVRDDGRLNTRLQPGTSAGADRTPAGPATLMDLLPHPRVDRVDAGGPSPKPDDADTRHDPDPRTLRLRSLMQRAADGARSPPRS